MALARALGDPSATGRSARLPVLTKSLVGLGVRSHSEGGLTKWGGAGSNPQEEMRARAELGAARAQLDREKFRVVAPFPFFGTPMCFQDEFAALQVTQDGRFYYSTRSFDHDAPSPPEKRFSKDSSAQGRRATAVSASPAQAPEESLKQQQPPPPVARARDQRVVTFAGTFNTPADQEAWLAQLSAMDPDKGKDRGKDRGKEGGQTDQRDTGGSSKDQKPGPEDQAAQGASIEGVAIVRYEMEEGRGGNARLVGAERGEWRFAITVYPYFDPSGVSILPINQLTVPGVSLRKRQLPYIGPAGCRWERHWAWKSGKQERSRPRSVVLSPLTRTAKAVKDTRPSKRLTLGATHLGDQTALPESLPGLLRRMEHSASAPQLLRESMDETRWLGDGSLNGLDNARGADPAKKLAEWKEFYRQRAEELLWKADTS